MASIGQAARLSGVSIETIRYYERVGVVPAPPRSGSGRRDYDAVGIARLRLIKRCRDLGFPLPDAQALLGLSEGGNADCLEVRTVAEGHLAGVRRRIAELAQMEAALAQLVRNCTDGNIECPALRALTEA